MKQIYLTIISIGENSLSYDWENSLYIISVLTNERFISCALSYYETDLFSIGENTLSYHWENSLYIISVLTIAK